MPVKETQEMWVRSISWKYLLEEKMVTYSSTLAWKIPWTEELVGYSPWCGKESDTTEQAGKFPPTQVSIPDP